MANRRRLAALMRKIEECWGFWDSLFSNLNDQSWAEPHGNDWVFSDVPFHLAYCERELIAFPIQQGPDMPDEKRVQAKTNRDVNRWNDSFFENRPEDQTGEQTLSELKTSRDLVRQAVGNFTDEDLNRQVWFPLTEMRGWHSLNFILQWSILHKISEFIVMRSYLKLEDPKPTPEINHTASVVMMYRMPYEIHYETVSQDLFTFHVELTDPGALSWTIRILNGKAALVDVGEYGQDFSLKTSLTSFFEMAEGISSFYDALSAGKISIEKEDHIEVYKNL